MKAPKSRLAKKILADEDAARDLVNAIRKNEENIEFEGKVISIKKVGKSRSENGDTGARDNT